MPTPIRKPRRPVNEMLRIFAAQAGEAMTVNLIQQRIWPTEVWPGYKTEVEGKPRPTGEGAESFRFVVTNDNPYEMEITSTFLSYMRFVDMGVGTGWEAEDVDRSKKAYYSRRYGRWIGHKKRVQRPAVLMEMRHILKRMRDYAVDFYGYEGTGYLINTFDFDHDEIDLGKL